MFEIANSGAVTEYIGVFQDIFRPKKLILYYQQSVELPDTPTRQNNHANIRKFMESVLTQDIVHSQLAKYI